VNYNSNLKGFNHILLAKVDKWCYNIATLMRGKYIMNKLSKITKKVLTVVIAAAIIVSSLMTVNAASDSIQLGSATKTKSYIAGVSFSYKVTTDNQYLYCLNIHKSTAQNVKANLVKNSSNITGGLVYILKNGYPNKSITGDNDKDYYITQTAVWWYLDKTTGSTNLGERFKETGDDSYNLRKYVKQLVDDGYSHRNDSVGITDTKLVIAATTDNSMTLKDNYYISNAIKATTASNVSSYTVTLSGAPSGTKIVKSDGTETTYSSAFSVKTSETFQIKVPASAVTSTSLSIKVTAKATGNAQYMAYEYQPTDTGMQNVALLEKTQKSVSSEITLDISSSKVSITKVDSSTNQAIAGAKLVLKDSAGNVITSWTSTINAHVIRNLSNGTYTIEETEAPTGYLLNTNVTKFTISESNKNIKVTIENAPKKVVVNITKVDQETNSPLAGAVLVVKDSAGNEVARFTTTEESYVLTDLADGTYTVEEESAPEGYIKSSEKISFTIDDSHLSHQITFINAKEVIVPNTSSVSSIIMLILGIVITGLGIRFVYKNGKKA
jgi:TQXA domain-containing protein